MQEERPWGYYVVLRDEPTYKVKKIVVNHLQQLSLQRHKQRAEHWFIVSGEARITLGNHEFAAGAGESFNIPVGQIHRIGNAGTEPLEFIEVQTGTYFGEDDIERLADDYDRL